MSKRSTQDCGNCGAWIANKQQNPASGQPRQGWCRRKSPTAVQVPVQTIGGVGMGTQGIWPTSNDDHWCAEWLNRDNVPVPGEQVN